MTSPRPLLGSAGVQPANITAAPGSAALPTTAPTPAHAYQTNMRLDQAANPSDYQSPGLVGQGWKGLLRFGVPAALMSAASGLSDLGRGDPTAGIKLLGQQVARDEAVPATNAAQYDRRNVQPLRDAAAAQQAAAQLAHTQAETTDIGTKSQQAAARYGLKAVTDDKGNTTLVPDTDSPYYKMQQDKDSKLQQQTELISAQVDDTKAQKELRDAQTDFTNSKNDPNSPAYKFAAQRLAVARQNASAASTRAQAYMGKYLQGAYNTGLDNKTLAGAPVISDDNGNQAVVGTANAGTAIKNQSNAAQFNDVHGALDSVENAATSLVQSGGKLNSPGVAAALAQPHGTLGQWLQGAGVKANLTPQERAYVQAIASAHENVQALRKSAGGTATDSAVAKLDAMIPGASTPDLDYLKGQTGQIRATAERLGKGATVATGGLRVRGQGITAPPASGAAIPASAAAQLQEGVNHTFGNGQVWTEQGGKPVRIK
jgi:hypothetical protein